MQRVHYPAEDVSLVLSVGMQTCPGHELDDGHGLVAEREELDFANFAALYSSISRSNGHESTRRTFLNSTRISSSVTVDSRSETTTSAFSRSL